MSTSDWYTRNAYWMSGIVLLGLLAAVGYFVLINIGYNEGYKEAQSSRSSGEAERELYKGCLRHVKSEEIIDCLETQIKPARAEQRAEEELQAQKDAASWALGAFIAGVSTGTLTLFITLVGIFFIRDTLIANTGMLEESRKATELAQKQFIASQRPWLKVEAHFAGPLTYGEDGTLSILLLFAVENIGNNPARDIWLDAQIQIQQLMSFDRSGEMKLSIERATSMPIASLGKFLFPNEKLYQRHIFRITVDQIKIATTLDDGIGIEFILPTLFGCVAYRFDASPTTHFTAFARDIRRTPRHRPEAVAKNRALSVIFLDDGDIAQEDLVFETLFVKSDEAC